MCILKHQPWHIEGDPPQPSQASTPTWSQRPSFLRNRKPTSQVMISTSLTLRSWLCFSTICYGWLLDASLCMLPVHVFHWTSETLTEDTAYLSMVVHFAFNFPNAQELPMVVHNLQQMATAWLGALSIQLPKHSAISYVSHMCCALARYNILSTASYKHHSYVIGTDD